MNQSERGKLKMEVEWAARDLIALHREKELREKIKRKEVCERVVKKFFEENPAVDAITVDGAKIAVARGSSVRLDMDKVRAFLGDQAGEFEKQTATLSLKVEPPIDVAAERERT